MKNIDHLMNNVLQGFGNLIVTDYGLTILALSESVQLFIKQDVSELLGTPLEDFLFTILGDKYEKFSRTLYALIDQRIPSQVFSQKLRNQYYYFKLSAYKGIVYIEWEEQHRKHIPVSRMNELGFLFDEIYINNWSYLCKALAKLLKFERVFILQVHETGQSSIISEYTRGNNIKLSGTEFDQSFFPSSSLTYYKSLPYRYNPHVTATKQKLYTLDPTIHLLCSQLISMPKLHEIYLKSIGVQAALFFPLYLEGQFWGLVIAQHHKAKKIDLQQRKLCTFIVQSAMSKFENSFKQDLIEQNQQLQEAEATLKQSLVNNKTINCAMVQNMDLLLQMVNADGFAIYNQGDVFFSGITPDVDQFYELIKYLQLHSNKTIFKDYNFRLQHGANFSSPLPFAGILYYTIGKDKDYYLIWFRKETISSIVQLEVYEQAGQDYIKTWEEPICDSAQPWDETDLKFVHSLQNILQDSIVSKATEKQLLTDELQTMNNELEMFTFSLSHDLKNPLSILKMGLQFLSNSGHAISIDKKNEWLKNLRGSVGNIEDIVDNIVQINQTKSSAMVKDPVPMSYTIHKICKEGMLLHDCNHCELKLGTLLPLWGEKSALYQIFLNIINNALKYSQMRKQPILWIESSMDEKQVCYMIKDNGIGIPAKTLPHIFDIFIRASNVHSVQGSGIGLSLVKRIMERLGGLIEIESVEDQGTTVRLYFPIVSPFPSTMLPKPV